MRLQIVALAMCCVLAVIAAFVGSTAAQGGQDTFVLPGKCAAVKCAKPANPCREAHCNPATGICYTKKRKDGDPCDDKNKCTINSKCINGFCIGVPVVCKQLPNQTICAKRVCVLPTGVCKLTPKNEGLACNDGRLCTFNDKCVAGKCVGIPKTKPCL